MRTSDWRMMWECARVTPTVAHFGLSDLDGRVSELQTFWEVDDSSSKLGALASPAVVVSSAVVVDEDFKAVVFLPVEQLVFQAARTGTVQNNLAVFVHHHSDVRRLWRNIKHQHHLNYQPHRPVRAELELLLVPSLTGITIMVEDSETWHQSRYVISDESRLFNRKKFGYLRASAEVDRMETPPTHARTHTPMQEQRRSIESSNQPRAPGAPLDPNTSNKINNTDQFVMT